MEIKFLVRIRGALTPPPRIEEPVIKMPLQTNELAALLLVTVEQAPLKVVAYHAAPTTDKPIQRAIPRSAHA